MNEIKLKHCPFCGGEASLSHLPRWGYWVECENMECYLMPTTVSFPTAEEAVDAWNRRSNDD